MKKGIIYILLIAQITLLLKPVLPYISDAVAHVFWYSKHMATVHYVNGKFHVHKDVIAEEKKNADKNPYSIKKEQAQSDYLIFQTGPAAVQKTVSEEYFVPGTPFVLPGNIHCDFPPPKCS